MLHIVKFLFFSTKMDTILYNIDLNFHVMLPVKLIYLLVYLFQVVHHYQSHDLSVYLVLSPVQEREKQRIAERRAREEREAAELERAKERRERKKLEEAEEIYEEDADGYEYWQKEFAVKIGKLRNKL